MKKKKNTISTYRLKLMHFYYYLEALLLIIFVVLINGSNYDESNDQFYNIFGTNDINEA